MKKVNILFILGFLIIILTSCPENNYDRRSIRFNNTSDKAVAISLGDGGAGGLVYPDTLLPLYDNTYILGSKKGYSIQKIIKYSQDTICLFVLDPDTLATYSWNQVRKDYNIIKRYDLSWEELAKEGYAVYYP